MARHCSTHDRTAIVAATTTVAIAVTTSHGRLECKSSDAQYAYTICSILAVQRWMSDTKFTATSKTEATVAISGYGNNTSAEQLNPTSTMLPTQVRITGGYM